MIAEVAAVLLPVFSIAALGYVWRRSGAAFDLDFVTRLIMNVAGPCLVLESLSLPVVGHLDPAFLQIMDQNMAMLREVFQTKNRLALPMSGTGSAGMETCFVNLIEPGDAVLIGVNGFFGTRMVDVARRCGAQVDTVEAQWGTALDPAQFRAALAKKHYKLVAIVHAVMARRA